MSIRCSKCNGLISSPSIKIKDHWFCMTCSPVSINNPHDPFTPEVLNKIMGDINKVDFPIFQVVATPLPYSPFGVGEPVPPPGFIKGYLSLMSAVYGPKGAIPISQKGRDGIEGVLSGAAKLWPDYDGVSTRPPIWGF